MQDPKPIFDITSFDPKSKKIRARLNPSARSHERPWRWPLPRLGNRGPIILAEHVGQDRRGVDLGYIAAAYDSSLFIPVYAVQAGEVSFALEGTDGFAISLDHGDCTTHYAHLSKMFVTRALPKVRRRQHVHAGEVIGYAAKSLAHIRFELWERVFSGAWEAIDPVPRLAEWTITSPTDEMRSTTPGNEAA